MAKPVMNTELVLEEPQQIGDGGGGFRTIWTPVGTLWGEVKSSSARERAVGARQVSEISHQITIRNAPNGSPRRPRASCRFRSGDRVFAIRGIAEADARGAFLTCWTAEEVYA